MAFDRRRGKAKGQKFSPPPSNHSYPEDRKKADCIYIDGEVTLSCKGQYKVAAENGMEVLATASKMDHRKISLIVGDYVTLEIPTGSLTPDGPIRGRIVWRMKRRVGA